MVPKGIGRDRDRGSATEKLSLESASDESANSTAFRTAFSA